MEGIGTEVSQKIRSAIKAKLTEIGVYVDEELPDYVMVMVANKRSKEQMDDELQLFLGKHTSIFTTWLHQVLQKLQEVTVANKGIKRRLSEETKKKKKSKVDMSKKEIKRKIKIENEEDNVEVLFKDKQKDKLIKDTAEGVEKDVSNKNIDNSESTDKNKTESIELTKEKKDDYNSTKGACSSDRITKCLDDHCADDVKAIDTSSQIDDMDDEDCINIRTDGELLDTAEELNGDDITQKPNENDDSYSSKEFDKRSGKKHTRQESPIHKHKSKSGNSDNNNRRNKKVLARRDLSPSQCLSDDKVTDARELLNRKKAAKQSESHARPHSKDRSESPPHKGRHYYADGVVLNKKLTREDERERNNRKSCREDERDQRAKRDRVIYSSKRKDEDKPSRRNTTRTSSRDRKRRESSSEPPTKRIILEKPFRNKNTRDTDRKSGIDLSLKKIDAEEPLKHTSLNSRVVPRNPQPEEDIETPVPSVVKVTQRPRRPPSQQPSSNLIMKAISEANKSLANMPQRPDSTQRSRKEPIFTRTLRKHDRIPPEKIAVSITNPLALQNAGIKKDREENKEVNEKSTHLVEDRPNSDEASNNPPEVFTSELAHSASCEDKPNNEKLDKEIKVGSPCDIDMQEPILQLEADEDFVEGYNDPMEEGSDPQFVVTLNGYDPDGLFTHGELDLGEDGECDDWLRLQGDEEAQLTSTPAQMASPRLKRGNHLSPNIIMNSAAVNHSNLIEVEIKSKTTERCKFWPACKLADKCTYYHPSKPCKMFPACKYRDTCLFIHPQCKYNALCTRKDCVFAHTSAHTPSQPSAVSKPKALYASSAVMTCKFYPNCTNINCQFAHPSRACRFGQYCTKKDCSFDHGQVPPVDKLKWTRVPSTT